jgi:Leucine-rich repeat (LRR) protein
MEAGCYATLPSFSHSISFTDNNRLSYTIPKEWRMLTTLKTLTLSNNQLRGTLPTQLGRLTNLREFDISTNKL